ncbi:MAG: PBP1A family penicillin-binding protein [Acidobacteria bacterium]|nr:PBP1A family penicillin-binding protein [Acidobacteriota bacterium]
MTRSPHALRARIVAAAGLDDPAASRRLRRRRRPGEIAGRLLVGIVVIAMTGLLISTAALPGAALLGRTVGELVKRFGGDPGAVDLPAIAQRSVVLARGGEVIATLAGPENRVYVPLGKVPPIAQQAVIAIEDAHFYEHHGVALGGLVRALFANARAGAVRQGGSTITQQLVKNMLVGNKQTLDRKIQEAKLAVALERRMSKRKILELYLNEAYFGRGVYGLGAAAEFYFGKDVTKLGLTESALLAGIIKAPNDWEPIGNPKAARGRRNLVLKRMADEGYVTRAQAERAARRPLGASPHPLPKPVEPYFVEYVKSQIQRDPRFGATRQERADAIFRGGLRIETTLDLRLQKAARDAVDEVLDRPADPAAALVSIDPGTGAVRAMVGGNDFSKSKYNLAVQGRRQAGSAFKPFTMVAALDAGVSPGLTFDTPSPVMIPMPGGKTWKVENYSHRGEGTLDMRRATELSVNSYYAQLISRIGPERVVAIARRMGIQNKIQPYLSLALGTAEVSPFEVASAYATLAAGGVHCRPFAIVSVTNALGEELMRDDQECARALDPQVAAQADAILRGVIERGTGRRNGKIGRPAAGKTGTTDDYADAWFVGFTPQFSTAVWLGFPESTEHKLHNIHGLPDVFGGSLPAMIWNRYMRAAHKGLPVRQFAAPPAVPSATVPDVGGRPLEEARKTLEDAGFSVRSAAARSHLPEGTVIAQSPEAGATVTSGALVTLSVSDGLAPSPPPSPSPSPSPGPSASPTSSASASAPGGPE